MLTTVDKNDNTQILHVNKIGTAIYVFFERDGTGFCLESAKDYGSEESFFARGRGSRQRKRSSRVLHPRLK
jgi:hypothetical protein